MAPTTTTSNGTRPQTGADPNGRAGQSKGPLTRLNYFDGKFLRAADMRIEQDYLRLLMFTSNLGGGTGVVHGYDTTLEAGDQLAIGAGLAIDRQGRVLLLATGASYDIAQLITDSSTTGRAAAQSAMPTGSLVEHRGKRTDHGFEPCGCGDPGHEVEPPSTGDYYLICVTHRESRCGQEDVYGHLCGDACATATDQPYLREGVAIRAIPLPLTEALPDSRAVPFSRVHLRSRLASALFRQEVQSAAGSLISRAGLGQDSWCLGSALAGDDCVPLAVLARSGGTNVFLDAWSVRRERIEAPARRYWAWRMRMRPWDVFLAHVLQFQCQLAGLAVAQPRPGELEDPCAPHVSTIDDAHSLVQEIRELYRARLEERDTDATRSDQPLALAGGMTRLEDVGRRLGGILKRVYDPPRDRVLLDSGIVELPSAGYLPVDNASSMSVNDQVRRLLGGGLDLRFCVVRSDFVAHALEEAQHMDRISLTYGLDHPDERPKVDILVPDGVMSRTDAPLGEAFDANIRVQLSIEARVALGRLVEFLLPRETGRTPGHIVETPAPAAPEPAAAEAPAAGGAPAPAIRGPQVAASRSLFRRALFGAAHGAIESTTGVDFAFAVQAIEEASDPAAGRSVSPMARLAGAIDAGRRTPGEALWVEIHCDRDLRMAVAGDRISVSVLVSLATAREAYQGELRGTFNVSRIGPGDGLRRELTGRFDGLVGAGRVDQPATTRQVRAPLSMLVGANSQGQPSFQIRLPDLSSSTKQGIGHLVMETALVGQLLTVDVSVGMTDQRAVASPAARSPERDLADAAAGNPSDTRTPSELRELDPGAADFGRPGDEGPLETIADGRFRRDPHVLEASNASHVAAITAINAIALGLHDRAFEEHARNTLFPPLPDAPADLVVRPTRDWVLFHRRRDIDCGPLMVIARPRQKYMVYGVRGDILTHLPTPTQIGPVEFDAESATLLTSPQALRADWQLALGGTTIVRGRIRASGGSTDAALLIDRLASVEQVLDPAARDNHVPNDVIASLPELDPEGTDGVILLTAVVPRPAVLLKVANVQLKQAGGADTAGNDRGHLEVSDGQIYVNQQVEFNAIDITFDGAPVDVSSVIPGKSLIVDDEASTGGTIIDRGSNVVRYYDERGMGDQDHKLILRGEGGSFIVDTDGRRLDGEYAASFPSGNQTEGGDFQIAIVIVRIN